MIPSAANQITAEITDGKVSLLMQRTTAVAAMKAKKR